MSILNEMWIRFTSKFIAQDNIGNKYYESNKHDNAGQKLRYVIYKNDATEPASIPPLFHGWLHHLVEGIDITTNVKNFAWQKDFIGTKFAYDPLKHRTKRSNVSADYQPFQPNKELL